MNMWEEKSKKNVTVQGGISFTEALQLIFIVLKLVGVVNWSWWVVLLPTLIPIGIVVVIILVLVFLSLIS